MSGTLYVVGTPIGNLNDMTFRAVNTLKEVDFIAAEDTRVTIKLLNHFKIKKPMISYFEHNKREKGILICENLKKGKNCALVSDAGMPAISDPGEDLVKQCHLLGINVKVIPGPSACISALCISGISTGRFTFEGFLSTNKKNRKEHLLSLKDETRTMIFYEAPHKLLATLKDFYEIFGNREISIIRELTKIHENVNIIKIDEAIKSYSNFTKGEIVIIIPGMQKKCFNKIYSLGEAIDIAKEYTSKGETKSFAAKKASEVTNIKKSDIYKKLVDL